MNKYWQHFKIICKHKWVVGKYCFKFHLYWQGIIHDMSKFSLEEFIPSAKYFQGDSSPIDAEKAEKGYSTAWLHHKAHNKHHQWYWMDWDNNQNPSPCRIPSRYVYEMIADWIGAGMVYGKKQGKKWEWDEPYEYYKAHNQKSTTGFPIWETATKAMIETILVHLKENGIDYVTNKIKRDFYGYKFYYNNITNEEGKETFPWIFDYGNLVEKYYKK